MFGTERRFPRAGAGVRVSNKLRWFRFWCATCISERGISCKEFLTADLPYDFPWRELLLPLNGGPIRVSRGFAVYYGQSFKKYEV